MFNKNNWEVTVFQCAQTQCSLPLWATEIVFSTLMYVPLTFGISQLASSQQQTARPVLLTKPGFLRNTCLLPSGYSPVNKTWILLKRLLSHAACRPVRPNVKAANDGGMHSTGNFTYREIFNTFLCNNV